MEATRTAAEAGWHISRYNISAPVPDSKNVAIANLLKGTCAEYTPIELYLMSVLDEIAEDHPIISRLAKRGVIANFDEYAALMVQGRAASAGQHGIGLTICPTIGCNFDCPYCFEDHFAGRMSAEVQDDIVALAERMLKVSNAKSIHVTWFGGEPLLAPDIIESLSARLIKLAEDNDATYRAGIITNGYLLTQKNIDLLAAAKVNNAQVTLDGIGATHDATRHLAGGGATFDRIVANLRNSIPFRIDIRHNVHEGNRDQVDELKAFVKRLADETGNELWYYPAPVSDSDTADKRGKQVGILCGDSDIDIAIRQESYRFSSGRGHYCGAQSIWTIGIDDKGNLQKCWEAVDKPHLSFGTAHDWDPADAIGTASNPDNLTKYINTAVPIADEECASCVWLPHCAGGCPHKRLYAERHCVAYKDSPEPFVLALHARIAEEKAYREAAASKGENA